MKIQIDRRKLSDVLSEASALIPNKPVVQVLNLAKFNFTNNELSVESGSERSSITSRMPVDYCDGDCMFLIDPRTLLKVVNSIKDDCITMVIKGNVLDILHAKGSVRLPVQDADDYPLFASQADEHTAFVIPASMLADTVSVGRNFVGTDDFRPMMKAIYAYIKNGMFGYCATDTTKLITNSHAMNDGNNVDVYWFIEPDVFASIITACKKGGDVEINIYPQHVEYKFQNSTIRSTQTIARFPDFNRVVPTTWNIECHAAIDDLLESLQRVCQTTSSSRAVKLQIDEHSIHITTADLETMKEASDNISVLDCSGAVAIGLHVDKMIECVKSLKGDKLKMYLTDSSRPVLIQDEQEHAKRIVLMPMSLN